MHFIVVVITLKCTYDMSITYTIRLCKTILYTYWYTLMHYVCILYTLDCFKETSVTGALKNISSKNEFFPKHVYQ